MCSGIWDLKAKSARVLKKKKTQERTEIFVVAAGSQGEGITTDLNWAWSSPRGSKVVQEGSSLGA